MSGAIQNAYFSQSNQDNAMFVHNGTNGYSSTEDGTFTLIDNTSIYTVTVLTGGSGYTGASTATFDAAPGGGTTATGTPIIVGGVITGVTITNAGTGYLTAPSITFADSGGGSNATGNTTLQGFPSGAAALVPGAVFLDGYTIVATKSGNIYNSDINDPSRWNPLNFTQAQADPDPIIGIVKHFNYICVFGEWSTEFFYDASVSPGSPFLRQDSYKNEVGCADGNSIVQFEQAVIFVGTSKTHGRAVYILDGVSPVVISTRYIERYLNADSSLGNSAIQAYVIKVAGHTLYVMSLPGSDFTFVYDVNEKEWYQWTSFDGSNEHYFSIWTATQFDELVVGLHATNGKLYNISTTVYQDDTQPIYWRVVTTLMDFNTMKRKFFKSLEAVGDKVAATLQIRHYDDDYTTPSNWRTTLLSNVRSIIYQCGQARRRAWEFLITDNVAIRLEAAEIHVEGGEESNSQQVGGG